MRKNTLFGAPIGANHRVAILILLPIAVLMLLLYLITGLFRMPEAEDFVLPSGNLSANVFEAQNMTYTKNQAFPDTKVFATLPYQVDTPEGATASVGDAQVITSNGYYFAYGEALDCQDFLRSGYTPILSIHSSGSDTKLSLLSEEEGYINGCEAVFSVYEISNPTAESVMYLCCYALKPTAKTYQSKQFMIVSCMAEGRSTANLANLQILAETMCRTIRYDSERAKKLGEVK